MEGWLAFVSTCFNETVNQTINFPGEEDNIKVVYSFKEKALGDNYFSSIKANGIALDVLGQTLTGDIDISPYEQGLNKGVKVNLSNGLGSFGVEGNEALVIEEATGELTMLDGQTSAVFSGALRFDLPNVSAAGDFDLNIDTDIGKVEIAGSEVSLKITRSDS